MLKITALTAKGTSSKSGADVVAYLKATEYLRDKDGHTVAASAWWGRGADALGLKGKPVDEAVMDALAQGFAPDGTALCRNAGEKPHWEVKKDAHGHVLLDKNGKERGGWVGGHRVGTRTAARANRGRNGRRRENISKGISARRRGAIPPHDFDWLGGAGHFRHGAVSPRGSRRQLAARDSLPLGSETAGAGRAVHVRGHA